MKRKFTAFFAPFLFLLIIGSSAMGQDTKTKERIDSLNNIPYDDRIKTDRFNIQKYLDNVETAEKIDYKRGLADSYANLSLIYFYKGVYDVSTEYLFKAINLYKTIGELGKAGSLYGLYGYGIRRKDLKKANEYMQIGISLAKQAGANVELLSLYDNYGVLKEENKQYDSAFYYYNKSLEMKKQAGDQAGIPYSLNKIAYLNSIIGNNDLAKKNFDEAYQIRLKLKDEIGIAENLSFYGEFYESQGNHNLALEYYKKALIASKHAGYRWLTTQIYEAISRNYEAKNDFKNAFGSLKENMFYKDSLYTAESTANRNELEVEFETEEKEREILKQKVLLAEQKIELQRKNQFMLILGSLILFIALAAFLISRFYKLKSEQLKKENELKDSLHKVEAENKVQEERLRISRDLHDNIGSQLTFIISSIDNLGYKLKDESPEATEKLKEINRFTRNTITELRDTIWAMNKNEISFLDLENRISNFVERAVSATSHIKFSVQMPLKTDNNPKFSTFAGINIFRIIQEAINNSIKHSGATEVQLIFETDKDKTHIIVRDNGRGFDTDLMSEGFGLTNMKKRISDLGGELNINSNPTGTDLKFSF